MRPPRGRVLKRYRFQTDVLRQRESYGYFVGAGHAPPAIYGKQRTYGLVCRGEHCSPAGFARYIALPGWLQRAVNDRPYGVVICLLQHSVMIWYFRQVCRGRIYASRAVLPLGRFVGRAATGGIVAVPTNNP